MTIPIHLLVINSLFIFGLNYCIEKYNIFDFIRVWYFKMIDQPIYSPKPTDGVTLKDKFLYQLSKPLFDCVVCMSSLWSIPFYFHYNSDPFEWVIYAICLAGLNRLLKGFA